MPAKNKHPFTEVGVLAYITERRGIRYQCSTLSRVFKTSTPEMRTVLLLLVDHKKILTMVDGSYRFYYKMTLAEEILHQRQQEKAAFRTLQLSAETKAALARCGELRLHPSKF